MQSINWEKGLKKYVQSLVNKNLCYSSGFYDICSSYKLLNCVTSGFSFNATLILYVNIQFDIYNFLPEFKGASLKLCRLQTLPKPESILTYQGRPQR